MHQTTLLGRDDVADNFRLHHSADQQKIVAGILLEAGKANLETALALEHGGPEQVEQRHQGSVATEACAQPLPQTRSAMRRKLRGKRRRFARKPCCMEFGGRGRAFQGAAQTLDRQFDGVALAGRQAGSRA